MGEIQYTLQNIADIEQIFKYSSEWVIVSNQTFQDA